MFSFFAKKKDPKELLKEAKTEIRHNQRKLDREIFSLDVSEKKTIIEIKKYAKKGQIDSAKELAKQIVLLRKQKTRFISTKAKLSSVMNELTISVSTGNIAKSLESAAKVIAVINKQINPMALAQTTQAFSKETMALEVKEEMINDAIDLCFDDDDIDEDTNVLVDSILDEIGVDIKASLPSVTKNSNKISQNTENIDTDDVDADELLKRLNALRTV